MTKADFESVVRAHQRMVFSIACNFFHNDAIAEEVAQEVFLQLYEHLRSVETGRHCVAWRRLAVAAVVLVMIGSFVVAREQHRRAEGEKAKQQLMVALRITGTKLRSVQERVAAVQQRAIQSGLDR